MGLTWLSVRVPSVGALAPGELEAIRDFTLLWSLFEARVLERDANPPRLVASVEEWDRLGALADDPFAPAFAYFQDRYFAVGAHTEHYAGLNMPGAIEKRRSRRPSMDQTRRSAVVRSPSFS